MRQLIAAALAALYCTVADAPTPARLDAAQLAAAALAAVNQSAKPGQSEQPAPAPR